MAQPQPHPHHGSQNGTFTQAQVTSILQAEHGRRMAVMVWPYPRLLSSTAILLFSHALLPSSPALRLTSTALLLSCYPLLSWRPLLLSSPALHSCSPALHSSLALLLPPALLSPVFLFHWFLTMFVTLLQGLLRDVGRLHLNSHDRSYYFTYPNMADIRTDAMDAGEWPSVIAFLTDFNTVRSAFMKWYANERGKRLQLARDFFIIDKLHLPPRTVWNHHPPGPMRDDQRRQWAARLRGFYDDHFGDSCFFSCHNVIPFLLCFSCLFCFPCINADRVRHVPLWHRLGTGLNAVPFAHPDFLDAVCRAFSKGNHAAGRRAVRMDHVALCLVSVSDKNRPFYVQCFKPCRRLFLVLNTHMCLIYAGRQLAGESTRQHAYRRWVPHP